MGHSSFLLPGRIHSQPKQCVSWFLWPYTGHLTCPQAPINNSYWAGVTICPAATMSLASFGATDIRHQGIEILPCKQQKNRFPPTINLRGTPGLPIITWRVPPEGPGPHIIVSESFNILEMHINMQSVCFLFF